MHTTGFFHTKAGRLTVAFIFIMVAFTLILVELKMTKNGSCMAGFVLLVATMLYSPVKIYVIEKLKNRRDSNTP